MPVRFLLVEDEKALSAAICQMLKRENFAVDPVYTGTDGFQVLKKLRQQGIKTPVCMLTARSGLEDRVRGLESGADYYLPKPFQGAELIACLRAITRRKEDAPVMALSFGDLELNQQSASILCTATGQTVKLGGKEYQLMELFMRNPRQILSKETIFDRVWGLDSDADLNSVEVYLSFLRKKLTFIGSGVKIKVSRGMGYSMEENP